MKIIVDAMSGDFAPKAQVEGAVMAHREYGVEIVLVGREAEILACVGGTLPAGITIVEASEIVTMEDDPATVIRAK